jgi:hypothetical protein
MARKPYTLALFLLVGGATLLLPARGWAQAGWDHALPRVGHDAAPAQYDHDPDAPASVPARAESYAGQVFCPVSGVKLGLNQPAVPVQTTIGEEKPSGLSKLFRAKPKPGMVIYACCPACAEKIRSNPQLYLAQVVADKSTFPFTLANAPDQRPAPPPMQRPEDQVAKDQAKP